MSQVIQFPGPEVSDRIYERNRCQALSRRREEAMRMGRSGASEEAVAKLFGPATAQWVRGQLWAEGGMREDDRRGFDCCALDHPEWFADEEWEE